MKALTWHGRGDVRYETVPDPKIESGRDAIVKVTSTAICGSDLHLINGFVPTMENGDILGHEFMGEVVDVGPENKKLKVGDRVVVPFPISCGDCFFCRKELWSCCDVSNPNKELAIKLLGKAPAAIFGYSHMMGGIPGGQAELVRVPYADVGPFVVPEGIPDEKVLFLTDILPTGYMAAENAGIEEGDTVAVWGCGPVGLFTIRCAWMLGAGRVIAIDRIPERLAMARTYGNAETLDFDSVDVSKELDRLTEGRGPDRCIDAVGTEAHWTGGFDAVLDKVKTSTMLGTDRPHVLRQAIMSCRKGGTVSLAGVYVGLLDKIPFGAAVNKGLTFRMGQTHVPKYLDRLMEKITSGDIDPSAIITHNAPLKEGPQLYEKFREKQDGCIKVVMRP